MRTGGRSPAGGIGIKRTLSNSRAVPCYPPKKNNNIRYLEAHNPMEIESPITQNSKTEVEREQENFDRQIEEMEMQGWHGRLACRLSLVACRLMK